MMEANIRTPNSLFSGLTGESDDAFRSLAENERVESSKAAQAVPA
jgi:hypothetical protein